MNRSAELRFYLTMRDQASAVMRRAADSMRRMGTDSRRASEDVDRVTHKMTELNQALEVASRAWQFLRQTVGGALGTFREYEERMTATQRLSRMSNADMEQFTRGFNVLGNEIRGLPIDRLNALGEQASRAGVTGTRSLLQFVRGMGELEIVLRGMGDQAPELIVRTLNVAGEGIDDINGFSNAMVAMAQRVPAAESRILNTTSLMAQATARFSVASEEILGFSAAAASLNFMPELFGTTMARVFNQLDAAISQNTDGMRQLARYTGLTRDEWRDLLANNPAEAVLLFARAYRTLSEDGRNAMGFLEDFGLATLEHMRIIDTMAAEVDTFRELLIVAREAAAAQTAVPEALERTMDKYYVAVVDAQNAWYGFKRALGERLAPAATAALEAMDNILQRITYTLDMMPDRAAAWITSIAALVPGLLAAGLAVRALGIAFQLAFGSRVLGMVGGLVVALARFPAILITIMAAASRVTAQFLLMAAPAMFRGAIVGLRAILGLLTVINGVALTSLIANFGAFLARGARIAALVAGMSRFGAIVARVVAVVARLGMIIRVVAMAMAALVSWPAAILAAVAGLALLVWRNSERIRGWFSGTGDYIAGIWDGMKDNFSSAVDSMQERWQGFRTGIQDTWNSITMHPSEMRLMTLPTEQIEAELALLQAGMSEMESRSAEALANATRARNGATPAAVTLLRDAQAEVARLQAELALRNNATMLDELDISGVMATDGISIDTSSASTLSSAQQRILEDMDTFTEEMAKFQDMRAAVESMSELSLNDGFFLNMGMDVQQAETYRARIQALLEVERQRLDPTFRITRDMDDQIASALAITAAQRQQLEMTQGIRDALETAQTTPESDAGVQLATRLREQYEQIFAARREAAVVNLERSLSQELAMARAITQEQQNAVTMRQRLEQLGDQDGPVSPEQLARVQALYQELFSIQAQTTYSDQIRDLDRQIALATALTETRRTELAIMHQIEDAARDIAGVTDAQLSAMQSRLEELDLLTRSSSLMSRLLPEAEESRRFDDDMRLLNRMLNEGRLSTDQYRLAVAALNQERLDAVPVIERELAGLRERYEVERLTILGMSDEADLMREINNLRQQGVDLSAEEVHAFRDLRTAARDLQTAMSSGFEGWVEELGTVQDRILAMQETMAESTSNLLLQALQGDEAALVNYLQRLSSMFLENAVDLMLAPLFEDLGNTMGGLFGDMPTRDGAREAFESAYQRVDSILQQYVNAANVQVTGGVVNVGGAPGTAGSFGGGTGFTPAGFTGDASRFLQSVSSGGALRSDGITGLNADFGASLAAMIQDAQAQFGEEAVSVFSGYRSNEVQAQLYQDAIRRYGSESEARRWVAPPGSSSHNYGMAADLRYGSPEVQQWMHQNAGNYGLNYRLNNEDWHIEPQNARGMIDQLRSGQIQSLPSLSDMGNAPGFPINAAGGSDGLAGGAGVDALGVSTNQLAQAQQALAQSQQALLDGTQSFGDVLQTTAPQMDTATQNLSLMGSSSEIMQAKLQMARTQTQMLGTSAQMAGQGTSMAAQSTQQLGAAAQAAAPNIQMAGAAISRAGGGAGGGLGQFGGMFMNFGLGLLSSLIMHDGGRVGASSNRRVLDSPAAYRGAPRFHTGLKSDEFRAILQRGETVLTEQDTTRTEGVLRRVAEGPTQQQQGSSNSFMISIPVNVNAGGGGGSSKMSAAENASMQKAIGNRLKSVVAETVIDMSRPGGPLAKMRG